MNPLSKMYPESPDSVIAKQVKLDNPAGISKLTYRLAKAPVTFAHLNELIDNINSIVSGDGYQGLWDGIDLTLPVALKGQYWIIDTGGTLATNGPTVESGDQLMCTVDNPTATTWAARPGDFAIFERNINVGTDPVPVARHASFIVETGPINDNISALDTAIGVLSNSTHYLDWTSSTNENLESIDSSVYTVNKKDMFGVDINRIKHTQLAMVVFNSTEPGQVLTVGNNTIITAPILPQYAIIKKVYFKVMTALTGGAGFTAKLRLDTGSNLTTGLEALALNSINDGIPTGLAANMVDNSGGPALFQLVIGANPILTGKIIFYVEYVATA